MAKKKKKVKKVKTKKNHQVKAEKLHQNPKTKIVKKQVQRKERVQVN